MNTKDHYATHLGRFYAWMVGDFEPLQALQEQYFSARGIRPGANGNAVDLGAGHGLQAISLANLGFSVKAIDFSRELLDELKARKGKLKIQLIESDLMRFREHVKTAELIVCMGDTLAHLESYIDLGRLLKDCFTQLEPGGKLILSFRDSSEELTGDDRFIPVKADDTRIHTCILTYTADRVIVTDQLYERTPTGWEQKISSYEKLRLDPELVKTYLKRVGFLVEQEETLNRMTHLIAKKDGWTVDLSATLEIDS